MFLSLSPNPSGGTQERPIYRLTFYSSIRGTIHVPCNCVARFPAGLLISDYIAFHFRRAFYSSSCSLFVSTRFWWLQEEMRRLEELKVTEEQDLPAKVRRRFRFFVLVVNCRIAYRCFLWRWEEHLRASVLVVEYRTTLECIGVFSR